MNQRDKPGYKQKSLLSFFGTSLKSSKSNQTTEDQRQRSSTSTTVDSSHTQLLHRQGEENLAKNLRNPHQVDEADNFSLSQSSDIIVIEPTAENTTNKRKQDSTGSKTAVKKIKMSEKNVDINQIDEESSDEQLNVNEIQQLADTENAKIQDTGTSASKSCRSQDLLESDDDSILCSPVLEKEINNPSSRVERLDTCTLSYSDAESQQASSKVSSVSDENMGIPIKDMNSFPDVSQTRERRQSTANHRIFVKTPVIDDRVPVPSNNDYQDYWDDRHVRLPCSNHNLYPSGNSQGDLKKRWSLIESALTDRKMTSSYDIEEAILAYNSRYKNNWDFSNLHAVFTDLMTAEERDNFFDKVLPDIIQLTLSLPSLIPEGIPLLATGRSMSLTFSQQQVACLVANAFFCTFPRRNATHSKSEYHNFPSINMNCLFAVNERKPRRTTSVRHKLKCLFHYFTKISQETPKGCITFKRRKLEGPSPAQWSGFNKKILDCHFTSTGLIEDADTLAQADFANSRVGGGALAWGCVQEEIQFFLHPELIASRLFTERLADDEVLIIKGIERFCRYTGYADSFRFDGDYVDTLPSDGLGRKYRHILAMDATSYRNALTQYPQKAVLRETNKAYCAFYSKKQQPVAIATGNWGCGAFHGDHRLKGLIQIMVASQCNRQLYYSAFGDSQLKQDLYTFHQFCQGREFTVGDLWNLAKSYHEDVTSKVNRASQVSRNVYEYIYNKYK